MPCIEEDQFGRKIKGVYDFCDSLEAASNFSTPYLLHFLFVPALIIIVLTLIDRRSEDAKWFMLNTAVINIITGIAWEMKRTNYFTKYASYINLVWSIGKDLSQYSIFLLAVTRVFVLYWPDAYKKLFARKFLFVWILASDALLGGLSHLTHGVGFGMMEFYMGMEIFMLLGTFGCSLFVILKIRKLKKLLGKNTQMEGFNNLRRASFACLFQAFFYSIYTSLLIYMRLYGMRIITSGDSTATILRILLRVFSEIQNPMFLLFTILDTLVPMMIIKSYRKTITKICLVPYRLFVGEKVTIATVSTYTTPVRINNLVKSRM
ncbi:hypothetical protein DdX_08434 [Ditylenchus destructor]|uniref:Uncharacterized protein n=1 Tax=Ditylenchus destructor TaxID=166010 RepID=A0AAD4N1Z9_9BILA|nr:hypothetical protein DdX_08434 [Ditylenchus destructor]